ncbi:MAG: CrcB family protein [Bifidobacteriaceae bacterium]|nr:CrcB family protein [Bifidobacteriaceae bacterium]
MTALAIAIGGALGAVARWALDLAIRRLAIPRLATGDLPVGILAVNALGSALTGLLAGLAAAGAAPDGFAAVAQAGFLGGFTTFSTACLQTVVLAAEGRRWAGAALGLAQVSATTLSAAAGLALAAALT